MKSVLTIAGLDPSGGAGILADVRTIRALGFHPSSVVTVITFQNTCEIFGVEEVDADSIRNQISAVLNDLDLAGIKIGLVRSEESARAIADSISDLDVPKVLDPVLKATVGFEFSNVRVYEILAEICDVLTPNAYEASAMSGIEVRDLDSALKACRIIRKKFGCDVVVTGGSLGGKDVIHDGTVVEHGTIRGEVHGTGCVYSTALTCYLAKGFELREACRRARDFVHNAVLNSVEVGRCLRVVNV